LATFRIFSIQEYFSSRSDVYFFVGKSILDNVVYGNTDVNAGFSKIGVSHAHNAFLQYFYSSGVIGLMLVSLAFFALLFRSRRSDYHLLSLTIFLVCLFDWILFHFPIYVFLIACFAREGSDGKKTV
jgi:hypothetical protein